MESLLLQTTKRKWYMAYRIEAIPMILSDVQGHLLTASRFKYAFVQLCSNWQFFNWRSACRGPSAVAELLQKRSMNCRKRGTMEWVACVCLNATDLIRWVWSRSSECCGFFDHFELSTVPKDSKSVCLLLLPRTRSEAVMHSDLLSKIACFGAQNVHVGISKCAIRISEKMSCV